MKLNDGLKWIKERNEMLKWSDQEKAKNSLSHFKLMYKALMNKNSTEEQNEWAIRQAEKFFTKYPRRTLVDSREVWFPKLKEQQEKLKVYPVNIRAISTVLYTESRDLRASGYTKDFDK